MNTMLMPVVFNESLNAYVPDSSYDSDPYYRTSAQMRDFVEHRARFISDNRPRTLTVYEQDDPHFFFVEVYEDENCQYRYM